MLKDKKLREEDKDELVDYGKGYSSNRESTLMRHIMSLRVNFFYFQGIISSIYMCFLLLLFCIQVIHQNIPSVSNIINHSIMLKLL